MKDLTVFLVDDDPGLREALALILAENGYWVMQAANGAEALGQLRAHEDPGRRVVLCDLYMPVMDGRQLVAAMREEAPLAVVKVILMTASLDMEEYRGASVNAVCVQKPLSMRLLFELLDAAV